MNEVRKVTLPSELVESGVAIPYSSEGKESVIYDTQEGVLAPDILLQQLFSYLNIWGKTLC